MKNRNKDNIYIIRNAKKIKYFEKINYLGLR
jgi:hypothetical protein